MSESDIQSQVTITKDEPRIVFVIDGNIEKSNNELDILLSQILADTDKPGDRAIRCKLEVHRQINGETITQTFVICSIEYIGYIRVNYENNDSEVFIPRHQGEIKSETIYDQTGATQYQRITIPVTNPTILEDQSACLIVESPIISIS